MYKEFYAGMEWDSLPIFALLLFMLVFMLTVFRTWKQNKTEFDSLAALPLSGDDHTPKKEVNL